MFGDGTSTIITTSATTNELHHLPLVPHICVSESGQHWFREWLVTYSAPSHYLKQCWFVVNLALRNKVQWNFNQNVKLSFKKMHLKTSSAIWWPFCPERDELILNLPLIRYLCVVMPTWWPTVLTAGWIRLLMPDIHSSQSYPGRRLCQ